MNIVITNDATDIAGGENYVLNLAEGLRKRGHNIIICPMENSMLAEESVNRGFETITIPYGFRGKEFKAVRLMTDMLKEKKIDIIHSNSNIDRTISAFVSRRIGCKNIASVHSCHSICHNILHWYRNKYLINHFIADGYSLKNILIKQDKISDEKITVIHSGVPEFNIVQLEEKRSSERIKLNIEDKDIVIGVVARLVKFKGIDLLIDVFNLLKKEKYENLKLIIVGDGPMREELEKKIRETDLSGEIIFTGYRRDLDNLFSTMDIYVQPSLDMGEEVLPLSAIQAKSAGLPVVLSDTGDLKYIVKENEDGFLVKAGDYNHLQSSLVKLINDSNQREKMGKESQINYRKNFTLEIMLEKVLTVYEKVMM